MSFHASVRRAFYSRPERTGENSTVDAGAYLDRIGALEPAEPTLDALAELALAQLYNVPFENLDIAGGRRLSVDLEALYDKIVTRRRGGFCYELNGLFAWLLRELGYRVTLLAAQVPEPRDGGPRHDRAHLVLLVELDGRWLVDVGWGEAYRRPLALRAGNEHADPHLGTYRLEQQGGRWQVREWQADAPPRVAYRFDLTPHELGDFGEACRWQETESPFFTRHRFCSIATPGGRTTLIDDRLIVSAAGRRTEREVAPDELPGLLAEHFGVVL
jgi:N-hydroxyarylamine O-acetyltransferase